MQMTPIYSSDGYLLGRVDVEDAAATSVLVARYYGVNSPRSVYYKTGEQWKRWTIEGGAVDVSKVPEAVIISSRPR